MIRKVQPSVIVWFILEKAGLELSESNGIGVKYGFILGLKGLLLLNSIRKQSQTKKKKQTTNKKKRKNQNQAYIKVDLDLDDS